MDTTLGSDRLAHAIASERISTVNASVTALEQKIAALLAARDLRIAALEKRVQELEGRLADS